MTSSGKKHFVCKAILMLIGMIHPSIRSILVDGLKKRHLCSFEKLSRMHFILLYYYCHYLLLNTTPLKRWCCLCALLWSSRRLKSKNLFPRDIYFSFVISESSLIFQAVKPCEGLAIKARNSTFWKRTLGKKTLKTQRKRQ